jgi:hypothetical protein
MPQQIKKVKQLSYINHFFKGWIMHIICRGCCSNPEHPTYSPLRWISLIVRLHKKKKTQWYFFKERMVLFFCSNWLVWSYIILLIKLSNTLKRKDVLTHWPRQSTITGFNNSQKPTQPKLSHLTTQKMHLVC